jgi:hypothetical protein
MQIAKDMTGDFGDLQIEGQNFMMLALDLLQEPFDPIIALLSTEAVD